MTGRIHAINISDGGVPKLPVLRADVGPRGIIGDRQEDTKHHGRPEQALCIWSLEVIEALQAEGHPIAPGFAGDNITIEGIEWTEVVEGRTLRLGAEVVAPVTWEATPCKKNAQWFLERNHRRMDGDLHPGWSRMYTSVTVGGPIAVGDAVTLE